MKQTDVLWHNGQTGETQVWYMNGHRLVDRGTVLAEDGNAIFVGLPWSIVGVGDMNGNGKADIVWHNGQTGETQVWYMNGHRLVDRGTVLAEDGNAIFVGLPWSIVGVGDMNGNGKADIVWHNGQTGETQVWYMNGHRLVDRGTVLAEDGNAIFVGLPWSIVGVGDMNGNGKADIVWHNGQTGETQVWYMNGHRLVDRGTVLAEDGNAIFVGLPWSIVGVGEFAALAPPATVTIHLNETYQTIDGFGVAQPGGHPDQVPPQDAASPLYDWPEPSRSQIMDLAFSEHNGIGLTILRMKINASLSPSPGEWNNEDPKESQVWIMREAARRGPVKLIASVWSPPAWMKSNGSTIGGSLKIEHYQHFADLLAHYAGPYARTNSVNIYAVSMSNEPDTDGVNWDTCVWTTSQIATFLSRYLKPTFESNHIVTKVIVPEAARWDRVEAFLSATYKNPNAFALVDIVAGHLYGGRPSQPFRTAIKAGKRIWQTEIESDGTWSLDSALDWAKVIHDGLTSAQISAWIWFVFFRGEVGDNASRGLIGYRSDSSISASLTFWALGNFSKFIRPGFVRVGTTTSEASLLDASAYKDPTTGKMVIVVINRNDGVRQVRFNAQGFPSGFATPYVTSSTQALERQPALAFPSTVSVVPARSIVTYVIPHSHS